LAERIFLIIIIKNNKAVGIMTDSKEQFFDIIISNILVQDLFTIVDEKNFPKKHVKDIKSLKGTGSLCAYYSLKKVDPGLIGKTFHFIERDIGVEGNDAVGMIDFMSASRDSGLSPSDEYLIQSYIICTPKEARDEKTLKTLRKLLDKNLKVIMPDFRSNLNWSIYPAIWHLDGVAKTIDNVKPDIRTPVENLYLVGDCVKAPGIGINCALNSVRILMDFLERNNN
jgi:phytoene dehydrogenase-like protein